jgi:hypothetical protein
MNTENDGRPIGQRIYDFFPTLERDERKSVVEQIEPVVRNYNRPPATTANDREGRLCKRRG